MIDDFKYYPARRLQASESPIPFEKNLISSDELPFVELGDGSLGALEDLLLSTDTIAFLIILDDEILFEQYFLGHTPSSLSQSFSIAKSFTSALIGMAIDDGIIRSDEEPVTHFVPELAQRGFSNVTIRHLLAMTSGSNYLENDNPFGMHVIFNFTPDLEEEILSVGMKDEPGQEWRYKSGDNALLGLILDRTLGDRTITQYTQDRMWSLLGMENEGVWSLDHEGRDGLEKTWCCLAATARDYAKLGRLFLHDGVVNGQRVLSTNWIRFSTQVGAVPEDSWPEEYKAIGVRNYGYQWWLLAEQDGDYLAQGKDGQFLYVNPAKHSILVRLGWNSGGMPLSRWIKLFKALSSGIG